MGRVVKKRCEQCNGQFDAKVKEVNRGRGRFCSVPCANKFRSNNRDYKNTSQGWKSYRGIEISNEYKSAQRSAHSKVESAIRRGEMKRLPCEKCGKEDTHAHHDDYKAPLSVRWLCVSHHRSWHAKNGPAAY